MHLNHDLLNRHRSFTHPRLGISETFVELAAGPGRTLGVLGTPAGVPAARVGWIMCHSFGMEELNLNMLHVRVARALTAAGYPVLRFHCHGYGESSELDAEPAPSTHVRDTEAAFDFMQTVQGVDHVGLCGIRFGAAVAAAVAARRRAAFMALVAPVVDTARYMKELMRAHSFGTLTDATESTGVSVAQLREELVSTGSVNLKGFVLDRGAFDEMTGWDLEQATAGFAGKVFIVQVSRTDRRPPGLQAFADHLRGGGATVHYEVVTDPAASNLGQPPVKHVRSDALANSSDTLGDALTAATVGVIRGSVR